MKPSGVVLCGGNSSRMGTDKAFIQYHNQPQWEFVKALLLPFCDRVYISCNSDQLTRLPQTEKLISDSATYAGHGPISGLLSVFDKIRHPLLVCACDYPLIDESDIQNIMEHTSQMSDVVCFRNPATTIAEPLIGWYSVKALQQLHSGWQHGEYSIRKMLDQLSAQYLIPTEWNRLFSVDTPEQRDSLI